MRVSFFLYSQLPLGRRLAPILELCRSKPLVTPEKVLLTSRERRSDLAIAEVIASAEARASDSCEIQTAHGSISLSWVYGERRHVPRLWGTLKVNEAEVPELVSVLNDLAAVAGTTYGVCDLETVRQESMATTPDMYASDDKISALHALYWWNYFGPEYRSELRVDDDVRRAASEVNEIEGVGLIVLTRRSPKDPIDSARIAALVRQWPVFRKYEGKAAFRTPVRIDYSEVWNLPAPVLREGPIGQIVGPPDEFIASVTAHAKRFDDWLQSKGLAGPRSEKDFVAIFQEHEAVIRDQLLVPAIAAYGELVRARMAGIWKKAELLHRGEPVVAKPGRPWTRRRVILEVLEGLEPVEI